MSLRTVVCVALLAALVAGQAAAVLSVSPERGQQTARTTGETTDPVAVIAPVPERVSNCTKLYLNGSSSYDVSDDLQDMTLTVVNYTWEITYGEEVALFYGPHFWHTFSELGLYKVKLTVSDEWGNSGVDFTALVSVDDCDMDGLPDWWEFAHFYSLDEDPDGDYDSDGYTNLEEWLSGTLPDDADLPPSVGFLEENWVYLLAAAAVVAGAYLVVHSRLEKRRREREAKKIEIALELEKSLEEEE